MKIQDITNTITKYFKIWWIPIVAYLIPFGIFIMGNALQSDSIIDISLIFFFINILGNLISSVIQIVIKKWYYLIPQIGISILLFYFVSIIFTYSPPDYYGANKTIPDDIEISEPIENKPTTEELEKFDLVLASSFQPGIYDYYTDYTPKESGYFYIRVFEITSNERLSENRMKERSKVYVKNTLPELYSGEIKIYEGSWGDKYGAKIELWFEPSNGKADYKITERNYVVEGWMR